MAEAHQQSARADAKAPHREAGEAKQPTDWALLRRLGPFVMPYKWVFVAALLLNAAEVASILAQPLLIRVGIDYHVATLDLSELPQLCAFFLAVVVAGFVARAFGIYLIASTGLRILASVRAHIYDHVTRQGQRFFDRRTTDL